MADDIDIANDLIDTEVARALSRMRAQKTEKGASSCVNCGDDIPPARQQLGFKLCVPCASESEKKRMQFANL